MSTATLLILSARLRSIARLEGRRDSASSAALSEGSRVTRRIRETQHEIRRESTGTGPRPWLLGKRLHPLSCAGARFVPLPRVRALVISGLVATMCVWLASHPARAQVADAPAVLEPPTLRVKAPTPQEAESPAPASVPHKIGGARSSAPCVIVDIAGDRAGHLDCATQRLAEAARIAQEQTRAGIDAPVPRAGSPDPQLGVVNQAATRLRMGSGFGNSVHPERPASRPPRASRP